MLLRNSPICLHHQPRVIPTQIPEFGRKVTCMAKIGTAIEPDMSVNIGGGSPVKGNNSLLTFKMIFLRQIIKIGTACGER